MRNIITAIAAAMLMGACWSVNKNETAESFAMVKMQSNDSTIYGTCLSIDNKGFLHVYTDNGDSLSFSMKGVKICGMPTPECLIALLPDKTGKKLRKIVNISMLMGKWVEPDPIAEGCEMGISLFEGGDASSINSRIHNYYHWSFHNCRLLLNSRIEIGSSEEEETDTFEILNLSIDSLTMRSNEYDGSTTRFMEYHYIHASDTVQSVDDIPLDTTDFMLPF